MKYIGLLFVLIIASACQNEATSQDQQTHNALNEELMLLQSEHNYLSAYLTELNADDNDEQTEAESDGYDAQIETFIDLIIPELTSIATVLDETETHSIALAYSTVNTHIQSINNSVTQLQAEIEGMSLSESQEIHFDDFQATNNELVETLELLRRGVETNDINQVNEAIESLNQFSNKY